jgi:hypothetical protein
VCVCAGAQLHDTTAIVVYIKRTNVASGATQCAFAHRRYDLARYDLAEHLSVAKVNGKYVFLKV